jgi:hypothetical protein
MFRAGDARHAYRILMGKFLGRKDSKLKRLEKKINHILKQQFGRM